jgi:hypothetical protein
MFFMPVIPMGRRVMALPFAGAVCLGLIWVQPVRAAVLGGDACSLLTPTQIRGVLGVMVAAGEHPIASSLLLCSWSAAAKSQAANKKVSISLMTERAFEVGKTPTGDLVVTPLGAVGEAAYYVEGPGLGSRLSVKNDGVWVQIRVEGFASAETKALERALALEILTTH